MNADLTWVAAASGLLGIVLGYLGESRRMSGRVATTDADRLWEQNNRLMEVYATDNRHLRERVTAQESHLWDVAERERVCNDRNAALEAKVLRLERMLKIDHPELPTEAAL